MTRRERPFVDKLAKTFEQFYDSPLGSTMREHPALLGRTVNKMTDREKVSFHIYIYIYRRTYYVISKRKGYIIENYGNIFSIYIVLLHILLVVLVSKEKPFC